MKKVQKKKLAAERAAEKELNRSKSSNEAGSDNEAEKRLRKPKVLPSDVALNTSKSSEDDFVSLDEVEHSEELLRTPQKNGNRTAKKGTTDKSSHRSKFAEKPEGRDKKEIDSAASDVDGGSSERKSSKRAALEKPERRSVPASASESDPDHGGTERKAIKRKLLEKPDKKSTLASASESDGDDDGDDDEASRQRRAHKRKPAGQPEKKSVLDDDSDSEGVLLPKKGRKSTATKTTPPEKGKKAEDKVADEGVHEVEQEEEEYEVQDIVGHKVQRGVPYFLIRWKGYGPNDDTWEAEETLSCPELIEKFKKKQPSSPTSGRANAKSPKAQKKGAKQAAAGVKSANGKEKAAKSPKEEDPDKEWEVDKVVDYSVEKSGRVFRIRWKGFGPRHDTWEPEENLNCTELIEKFMLLMEKQKNVEAKELREDPKRTKRLVIEAERNFTAMGRKSKRSVTKQRIYYGDSDE